MSTPTAHEGSAAVSELSGDGGISATDRLRYLYRNLRRNVAAGGDALASRPFRCRRNPDTPSSTSPNRAAAEAFIRNRLPELLPPKSIRVLDIGCGSGSLSGRLALAGYSGSYIGVDIQDRFTEAVTKEDTFERRFFQGDVHDLAKTETFDLIVSVSALEHIPNDTQLVANLDRMTSAGGMQVHFVPSGWALPLYLWHGYRQYPLKSLRERFDPERTEIYRLGGAASYLLHFIVITLGEMLLRLPLRKRFGRLYGPLLDTALWIDRALPFVPAGYVVCQASPRGVSVQSADGEIE